MGGQADPILKVKAISLFSGGLDSILAVKLIQEQGIDIEGVTFETPFFNAAKAQISSSISHTGTWTCSKPPDMDTGRI